MSRKLEDFGCVENTVIKYLEAESEITDQGSKSKPRIVNNAHFTFVEPELVEDPYLVAASASCASSLGLDTNELITENFVEAFCGNILLKGLNRPYCTNYGCHSYGQWFGQLGDGRAVNLGEVFVASNPSNLTSTFYSDHVYELQLKGSGRSPYSRGFDGRAVLRSSVREYLGFDYLI
jgi:uncharacterized protein YdiU (UPF0061 family)